MRIAKNRGIKVLLDGQGSDEILGGYNAAYFPYFASLLRSGRWGRFIRTVARHRLNGKRMTPGAWMTVFLSCFPTAGSAIRNQLILRLDNGLSGDFVNSVQASERQLLGVESSLTRHLVKDMNRILRSLLMYEDKNSMAFSIEARVPFLDYRLVEFLFSLPDERKIDRGLRKVILREAMRGTVPDKILDRRDKIGFATEQDRWFQRGTLREAMRDVFHSAGFQSRGYFDARAICKAFDVLPTGKKTYINFWACFHLEMWFRRFIETPVR
jgi:asparagine synthase (glutamine-hydrolysing)